MRRACAVLLLVAGCAPLPPVAPVARWWHVERPVSGLDYPAGDGAVPGAARVLVLSPTGRGHRPPATIHLPSRVGVGEIFRIEIRVPRADDDDRRTFRILGGRPGLRLLDGDVAVTLGRDSVTRRAIADSPGPATFELEEIGD